MNVSELTKANQVLDALYKWQEKVHFSLNLLSDTLASIYSSDSAEGGDLPEA